MQTPESSSGSGESVDGVLQCNYAWATRRCTEYVRCTKGEMERKSFGTTLASFEKCRDVCKCEMAKGGA